MMKITANADVKVRLNAPTAVISKVSAKSKAKRSLIEDGKKA